MLLTLAGGAVVAVAAVGIEAAVRGHIGSPATRAPSALYTRPTAWAGAGPGSVAIGPINPALNEFREPVELAGVSRVLIDAVLAVEDQRFHEHHGLDPRRIAGAFVANVRARRVAQGGSTITQQLAKNLFLSARRTPLRKIREAALAVALELRYSKEQILEAYLNEIYLGQDGPAAIHGVGAASRFYFGKAASRVTLAEAALLAGMIRSPNRLAPTRHPNDARARRDLVLGLMVAQERVTPAAAARARNVRVSTRSHPRALVDGRYFRDFVSSDAALRVPDRGRAVYTTLDAALQRGAERAVERGLSRLGRASAQAALIAIDPRSGDVVAMVGGRDYAASQFNRATAARRQPGSAFKPIVALAALQPARDGVPAFTLASSIDDQPLAVPAGNGTWRPVNHDGDFRGAVTFRDAMEQSLNVPLARVGLAIGPERIATTARELGIESRLNPVPSLALGSSEVTLLELTRAYGVFATGGELAATRVILGAEGNAGATTTPPRVDRVADAAATFLVTSALQGAVQRGTGRGLTAGRDLDGDIAGKTGTSNDSRDAWFIAYSPDLVVGVWVGHDDGTSLRASGASAAVPIAADFLSTRGVMQGASFDLPDGIEVGYVPAGDWGSCGEREYYLDGTAPPAGWCGLRVYTDHAVEELAELGARIRRALERGIRREIESRRFTRDGRRSNR